MNLMLILCFLIFCSVIIVILLQLQLDKLNKTEDNQEMTEYHNAINARRRRLSDV